MATLELAKRKWARKMANAGAKWKAAVTGKTDAYVEGIRTSLGLPVGPITRGNWTTGVDDVSAADFQSAVSGKEDYWARRLAEGLAA